MKKELIKTDNYLIVVDDSEIKVGDWVIETCNGLNAPADFECVWQKEIVSSLTQDTGSKKAVEKLFKFSPTNVQ